MTLKNVICGVSRAVKSLQCIEVYTCVGVPRLIKTRTQHPRKIHGQEASMQNELVKQKNQVHVCLLVCLVACLLVRLFVCLFDCCLFDCLFACLLACCFLFLRLVACLRVLRVCFLTVGKSTMAKHILKVNTARGARWAEET